MFKWSIIKIFFLSIFLTILIFIVRTYYFSDKITEIEEEKYIDTTTKEEITYQSVEIWKEKITSEESKEKYLTGIITTDQKEKIKDKYIEKLQQEAEDNPLISFVYIPSSFKLLIEAYSNNIDNYLNAPITNNKLREITIEFYQELVDVRWKMKDQKILLFWPENMWETETMTVFVHELWHYIDLYFFSKKNLTDQSVKFYDISWNWIKNIKHGQQNNDFVSGYAMTNRYEDFAESFTYYVLHNKDFLEKTEKSTILKEKYKFFKENLFTKKEFIETNFSTSEIVKNYYWDITKIDINLKNFLQYVQKEI